MGLFGGIKSAIGKANSPGDNGTSFIERLGALGQVMQGDPEAMMRVMELGKGRQKDAAKARALAQLTSALGPQYEDGPAPIVERNTQPTLPDLNTSLPGLGAPSTPLPPAQPYAYQPPQRLPQRTLNDPQIQQALIAASLGGVSGVGDLVSLLDKTRPIVKTERGYAYDERDPSNIGRYFMDLDKGQRPTAAGGVENAPGAVASAAEMAGATAGATEQAKSALDLVDVPQQDGTTRKMTRFQAAQMLSGQGGRLPPGFGQTRAPEVAAAAEGTAKAQVELNFMRPKAEAALTALDTKTKVVGDAIDRAIGMVDNWSAGPGAMLKGVPTTRALDLAAELETIKANIGFDELQTMRDNSPTGGALGQVAVQELEALRSTISSLKQEQSPAQLKAALQRIKEFRESASKRRRAAFDATYNQRRPAAQGRAQPDRSAIEAELRRRNLIQ